MVGGGVAGISAAVHLAAAGRRVTLIEQRNLLGGRAGSFAHRLGPRGLLDSSQHVLLGCCTELQGLYRRLGVSHLIHFDRAIHFADRHGVRATMQASWLPSPLHLGPSLLSFPLLKLEQKLEVSRAMARMMLDGREGREAVAELSLEAYLRQAGQSAETIRDFWDVICVSALNEPCRDASAKYGLQVFQESLLGDRDAYRVGYARVPLAMLYERLPGVEVLTGCGVRELIEQGDVVRGVRLADGQELLGDQTILAAGGPASLSLLRPLLHLDPRLAVMEHLQYRPILGAHLLYDRPIPLKMPVALVGTHLQWIFPNPDRPELLHGVVSAADLLPEGVDLKALFDAELRLALNGLGGAKLVEGLLVREVRATFRPAPGVDRYRPTQATRIPGLTLAGDYTRTEWPATMEGAARSGRLTAEVIA